MPAGGVTVAVFISWPAAAAGSTVPVTVKVTTPPTGRLTVVAMLPVPLPTLHVPFPAVVAQVQLGFASRGGTGNVSVTVAPTTLVGPWFPTAIVYVMPVPGAIEVRPLLFAMNRSATRLAVTVALDVAGVGSF